MKITKKTIVIGGIAVVAAAVAGLFITKKGPFAPKVEATTPGTKQVK